VDEAAARPPLSGSALASLRLEHVLDERVEETADLEREMEARIVSPALDRVHGLARDAELLREIGLGPVAFGAEDVKAIFHGRTRVTSGLVPRFREIPRDLRITK
jgi:hypothetical protein